MLKLYQTIQQHLLGHSYYNPTQILLHQKLTPWNDGFHMQYVALCDR